MVTEDFLTVAVQTVWLVAGRVVHRSAAAGTMDPSVAFGLQHHPPVATGIPPDARTSACIAELTSLQRLASGTTDNERLAVFYLSVLAEDPAMMLDMAAIAPTSAWRSRPYLVNPAY